MVGRGTLGVAPRWRGGLGGGLGLGVKEEVEVGGILGIL